MVIRKLFSKASAIILVVIMLFSMWPATVLASEEAYYGNIITEDETTAESYNAEHDAPLRVYDVDGESLAQLEEEESESTAPEENEQNREETAELPVIYKTSSTAADTDAAIEVGSAKELSDALNALNGGSGGIITLAAGFDTTTPINISTDITIELAGFTVNASSPPGANTVSVQNAGTLTISGAGTLNATAPYGGYGIYSSGGTLELNNGAVVNALSGGNYFSTNSSCIYSDGGSIIATTATTTENKYTVLADNQASVTITDGIVGGYGVFADNGATVTVTGGVTGGVHADRDAVVTVTGEVSSGVYAYNGATVSVTGNVEATSRGIVAETGAMVSVLGNVFSTANQSSQRYCIDASGNSKVIVTGDVAIASGTFNYGIYARTNADVTVNGSISILGNTTGSITAIDAVSSGAITVNGNISGSITASGNTSSVSVNGDISGRITVSSGVCVDITGNILNGVSASGTGTNLSVCGNITGNNDGVVATDRANVSVTGDVLGNSAGVYAQSSAVVSVTGNVTGGEYGVRANSSATVGVEGNVYVLSMTGNGVYAVAGASVSIEGFISARNYIWLQGAGYSIRKTKVDFDEFSTKPGYFTYSHVGTDMITTSVWVKGFSDTEISVSNAEEFKNALDTLNAGTGGRIRLTESFTYEDDIVITQNIVLYPAGFDLKIIAPESGILCLDSATLLVTGPGTFTAVGDFEGSPDGLFAAFETVVIVIGNVSGGGYGVHAYGDAVVTVTGDVIAADSYSVGILSEQGASVTVFGSVTAVGTGSRGIYSATDSKVDVTGDIAGNLYGIYLSQNATVSVVGNVTGSSGISSYSGCTVEVAGDVTGAEYGVSASGDTQVRIVGDVSGVEHGVYAFGDTQIRIAGSVTGDVHGVYAQYCANVVVIGSVTGGLHGIYAEYQETTVTVSGDVTATGDGGFGVNAIRGSSVSVYGNVTVIGSNSSGINADENAKVYVSGDVFATGENGIGVFDLYDSWGWWFVTTITIDGNVSGRSCGIMACNSDTEVTVKGDVTVTDPDGWGVFAGYFSKTTIEGQIFADEYIVFWDSDKEDMIRKSKAAFDIPTTRPTYYTYSNLEPRGATIVWVKDQSMIRPNVSMGLTPSHSLLGSPTDSAVYTLTIYDPLGVDNGKINWSVSDPAAVGVDYSQDNKSITVYPLSVITEDQTVAVVVEYYGYQAVTTVQLLPSLNPNDLAARVLEDKVTVNRLKTTGALLPVVIEWNEQHLSLQASEQSLYANSQQANPVPDIIDRVELWAENSGIWYKPQGYTARMSETDHRYIEINADDTAENVGNVEIRMWVRQALESEYIIARSGAKNGMISLSAVSKYPTIKMTAENFDLFDYNKGSVITAVSNDGACTIVDVYSTQYKYADNVNFFEDVVRLYDWTKTGSISITVELTVDGYHTPYKNPPKVNVRITNNAPKLKLTPATIKIWYESDRESTVQLVSTNKKRPLSSYGEIEQVIHEENGLYYYGDGVIGLREQNTPPGRHVLEIYFKDKPSIQPIRVRFTAKAAKKLSMSAKTKSFTLNLNQPGETAVVDINTDPHNLNPELAILNHAIGKIVTDGLPPYISATRRGNRVTFTTIQTPELENLKNNTKLKIRVVDNLTYPYTKPVEITLTFAYKEASYKVKTGGKIDIIDPQSRMTAAVTLAKTTSTIKEIALYEQTKVGGKLTEPVAISRDFSAAVLPGGRSFAIFIKEGRFGHIVPGIKQVLSVEITLRNGKKLTSWSLKADGTISDKPVSITPTQGTLKLEKDSTTATLNTFLPYSGSDFKLRVKAPANAKIGFISFAGAASTQKANEKLGFPDGGFEIIRKGESDWTICFKDGELPTVSGIDPAKLKASYTVKLELWPEGSYMADSYGNLVDENGTPLEAGARPKPLTDLNGSAKSKPVLVSVKVNIKQ